MIYKFSSPSCIVQLPFVPSISLPFSFVSFDKCKSPVYRLAQVYDDEPKLYVFVADGTICPEDVKPANVGASDVLTF